MGKETDDRKGNERQEKEEGEGTGIEGGREGGREDNDVPVVQCAQLEPALTNQPALGCVPEGGREGGREGGQRRTCRSV